MRAFLVGHIRLKAGVLIVRMIFDYHAPRAQGGLDSCNIGAGLSDADVNAGRRVGGTEYRLLLEQDRQPGPVGGELVAEVRCVVGVGYGRMVLCWAGVEQRIACERGRCKGEPLITLRS